MCEFFNQDHLETLSAQFPDMNRSDIYLRTYPYKFGVYCIFLDAQGKSASTYHTAFQTRAAFELIKRLAELARPELVLSGSEPGSQPPPKLSAVEKGYLKVQLNAAINAPHNDLAAVLTEINALLAFYATVDKVEIGDGLNRPDVWLNDVERQYHVQCKSLGLSEDETNEVSGMYRIAQAVQSRLPELKGLTNFSCWHIRAGQLAYAGGISQAIAMINMFIDYSSGKVAVFPERSPTLNLVCHTRSGDESFSDFLGRALPIEANGRRFAPFIPEIVGEFTTPTPPNGFVFVSFRNVRNLAKRTRLRFNVAMNQHERMHSLWPIVFLNIESPHDLIRAASSFDSRWIS